MNKLILICLVFVNLISIAQVSPYNISPIVINETKINDSTFKKGYVISLNTVSLSQQAKYSVRGKYSVRVMPGSHAGGFNNNGYFHAFTGNNVLDVVSFHQNGFNDIPTYDKFELGIKLPQPITQKIDDFFGEYHSVLGGGHNGYGCKFDLSNGNINPYDPEQISVEATFYFQGKPSKKVFGFYYRDYNYKYVNPNLPASFENVDWEEKLDVEYHWRVRFAPQFVGTYTVTWQIKGVNGVLIYEDSEGQVFNTIQSNDRGYVKLGQTKNFLVTKRPDESTAKTILPIGMVDKLPIEPIGDNPLEPIYTHVNDKDVISIGDCGLYGCKDMHYPYRYINHREEIKTKLKDKGANLVRIWNLYDSYDIEYERAGIYDANPDRPIQNGLNVSLANAANFSFSGPNPSVYKGTNRQAIMWEFDKILEMAHQGPDQLYIQLVLEDPNELYTYRDSNQVNNDWITHHPYVKDTFAKVINNPQQNTIRQLFEDQKARKFYKKKLRYLISRYGYSTNILAFELFNEHEFLKAQIKDLSNNPSDPLNSVFKPWLDTMVNYIKGQSGLNHNEHLLCLSYANISLNETDNNCGKIDNIDFLSTHPYVNNNFQPVNNTSRSYHGAFSDVYNSNNNITTSWGYLKPCQAGEMGIASGWPNLTRPMFPEFMNANSHSLIWATTFIGGLTSGLQMWYSGLNSLNHLGLNGLNHLSPDIKCGQGFTQHFRPLQEFIKDINFDDKEYTPKYYWNGDESGVEAFYLISEKGSDADDAIGYIRNRTFWWYNFANPSNLTYYDSNMVQAYNNSFGASGPNPIITTAGPVTRGFTHTFEINGFKPMTQYKVRWYDTYIDPSMANNLIQEQNLFTFNGTKLVIQTPVFNGCQRQEFGFKISKNSVNLRNASNDSISIQDFSEQNSYSEKLLSFKEKEVITLYPNPTKDYIYLKFEEGSFQNYTIVLSDLSGREIRKFENRSKLDLSFLNPGCYTLSFKSQTFSKVFKVNVID